MAKTTQNPTPHRRTSWLGKRRLLAQRAHCYLCCWIVSGRPRSSRFFLLILELNENRLMAPIHEPQSITVSLFGIWGLGFEQQNRPFAEHDDKWRCLWSQRPRLWTSIQNGCFPQAGTIQSHFTDREPNEKLTQMSTNQRSSTSATTTYEQPFCMNRMLPTGLCLCQEVATFLSPGRCLLCSRSRLDIDLIVEGGMSNREHGHPIK